MGPYLGDFQVGATVHFTWDTNGANGASITRATNGTISVYKNNGTTQDIDGVTDTEDFDTLTGVHACTIDLSADATFYSAGANFSVVLSAATIDSQTVNATIAHFSIENRSASFRKAGFHAGTAAAIANGTITLASGHGISATASALIYLTGGTAAFGKSRIITYSGTGDVFNVDPAWNAAGETTPSGTITYVVAPMPPAPTGTVPAVNVTQISGDSTAADNAEAFFDGTGYAGTNNVIPTVTAVTNQVTANVAQISGDTTAADNAEAFFDGTGYAGTNNTIPTVTTVGTVSALAANSVNASALAANAVDEILDEVITGTVTMRQALTAFLAVLVGKASGLDTTTAVYRNVADDKDVVTATVDADGNRTAVTLDLT